jgi:hypothetical protein
MELGEMAYIIYQDTIRFLPIISINTYEEIIEGCIVTDIYYYFNVLDISEGDTKEIRLHESKAKKYLSDFEVLKK